jgi:hypothetical protein
MQKWHRTPRTAGQLGRLLDLGVQPSLGRVDSLGLLANLGVGFSPFGLFADGSQGVWYDPSDLSTLFQDAAGTTPVTAVEQPVRVMLDKSGNSPAYSGVGPDTVINGTFAVDADWTKGTGWAIGSGVATKTAGTAAVLSQAQTLVAGRSYLLTYTITRTAGTLTAQFTGGTTVSGTARSVSATFTEVLQAVTGNTTLEFSADASYAGTVDNVTLVVLPLGNHAIASADARRPVLSARVNLLQRTEEFDNAYWTLQNASVTPNAETAPNGTQTADLLISNSGFPVAIRRAQTFSTTTRVTVVLYVKKTTVTRLVEIVIASNENLTLDRNRIYVNPETGVASSLQNIVSSSSTDVGNGWFRITMVADPQFSGSGFIGITAANDSSAGDLAYIWGMDLRVTNDGVGLPVYQRVTTSTDYDTAGFPRYLRFDGTDDCLLTGNVDFTATDKVTVCAGVRKLSDADGGIVTELSATSATNAGSFRMLAFLANGNFGQALSFGSRGSTTTVGTNTSTVVAPASVVVTGLADIAAPSVTARANGSGNTSTSSQGTGNYGNYPLFIGARDNGGIRFPGRLHQLVIVNKLLDATTLTQLETFTNQRTAAY